MLNPYVVIWEDGVVGGCNLVCGVVFFSSRITVDLGQFDLWCRTSVQKKLTRLEVVTFLDDHLFFVIELPCFA